MSIWTFFRITFSGTYPKSTPDNCNRGGDIFSTSGNLPSLVKSLGLDNSLTHLKLSVSSSSGGSRSGSFSRILIRACACAATAG
jgi:hypothetical protein